MSLIALQQIMVCGMSCFELWQAPRRFNALNYRLVVQVILLTGHAVILLTSLAAILLTCRASFFTD